MQRKTILASVRESQPQVMRGEILIVAWDLASDQIPPADIRSPYRKSRSRRIHGKKIIAPGFASVPDGKPG